MAELESEEQPLRGSLPERIDGGHPSQELRLVREQLDTALRESRALLSVRDRVLAAISHDLRTPLTTIRGVTQVLLRRVDKDLTLSSPQVLERLILIDRAVSQMGSMIDELLDYARLEDGRALDLNKQPVDLVTMVRRLIEDRQRGTEEHSFRLQTTVEKITGSWDQARLERVLTKLLANAARFSPPDTTIDVRLSVQPGAAGVAPQAEVAIEDQGSGIVGTELPHILERRSPEARSSGRASAGRLGLPAARQIVEQHGGTLQVKSEIGRGSTFTVRLPIEQEGAR